MKLRIRGNSVRLRLTRTEVDRLAAAGQVSDSVCFGAERCLGYRVTADAASPELKAVYGTDLIDVRVPAARVAAWARSNSEVSIEGDQVLSDADGDSLRILVEKDFACLQPRAGEDDSDMFAHPAEGRQTC
jgi:hypothetical protein